MATKKTTKSKPRGTKTTKRARPAAKKVASKAMDEAAMMAAWQKAMLPGEGHRRLEPLVGNWLARTTFQWGPDTPPDVNEGTSEHRWVLGGRFLEQVYRGLSMGMPFEGIGYTGYDNVRRKYVGTWMDSFGTGLMLSDGVGRPSARAMSFVAEAYEPSGKKVVFDCKLRILDDDHHTYEMWTKAPDGRRFRNMLVEYTRV